MTMVYLVSIAHDNNVNQDQFCKIQCIVVFYYRLTLSGDHMRFSERQGDRLVRTAIQTDGMDIKLRNSLWNVVQTVV